MFKNYAFYTIRFPTGVPDVAKKDKISTSE